jgi:anhydro-N-acetylmuramic acid kinase
VDHPRILLNLGGMANVSWIRRRGEVEGVIGADTGPGMAVIDAVARLVDPALPFDVDGRLAREGTAHQPTVDELLREEFFVEPPPRSTGRERFGAEYARLLHARLPGPDGVRTAVALTAESVWRCCRDFLPAAGEVLASGGGTRHPVLMDELRRRFATRGTVVRLFQEEFFPGQAKEAVAFALLGWLTLHGQPGNVPSVTGATGARVLGSVTGP